MGARPTAQGTGGGPEALPPSPNGGKEARGAASKDDLPSKGGPSGLQRSQRHDARDFTTGRFLTRLGVPFFQENDPAPSLKQIPSRERGFLELNVNFFPRRMRLRTWWSNLPFLG